MQHAEKRGIKGLFITVDAPELGHREKVKYDIGTTSKHLIPFPFLKDLRMKIEVEGPAIVQNQKSQDAYTAFRVNPLLLLGITDVNVPIVPH